MSESGEIGRLGQWYLTHPAALPDVLRAASLAHENSGQRQFVHRHAHGQPCAGECREVDLSGSSGPEAS